MGLDNGLSVRRNKAFERNYEWFKKFDEKWCKEYGYNPDICYWRKCWNIRNAIFDRIDGVYDNEDSENLSIEDINEIIEILASFTEDNWNGSIWAWEEIQPHLCEQCATLMELYDLMVADPEIKVYFYDSY